MRVIKYMKKQRRSMIRASSFHSSNTSVRSMFCFVRLRFSLESIRIICDWRISLRIFTFKSLFLSLDIWNEEIICTIVLSILLPVEFDSFWSIRTWFSFWLVCSLFEFSCWIRIVISLVIYICRYVICCC